MRRISLAALTISLAFGSVCGVGCSQIGVPAGSPGGDPARLHEASLVRLFDAVGLADVAAAERAAAELAALPDVDRDSTGRYWLRRSSDPVVARRIGEALVARAPSDSGALARAMEWYRRGLKALDTHRDYVAAAEFRLLLARAMLASGDRAAAAELAGNRLDTRPLPDVLEAAYAELIAQLAG